tara:strand:+ start:2041 stop:2202 length:162 start_codon:yes stop_codon:yes gene_type:complete
MKLDKIEITFEMVVSVQQAIFSLEENPKAATCVKYLKQLQANMAKAKIISEGK